MPTHREFRAHIEVDGKAAEEYAGGVDPANERVYKCWIPSEAGKVRGLSLIIWLYLAEKIHGHCRPSQ